MYVQTDSVTAEMVSKVEGNLLANGTLLGVQADGLVSGNGVEIKSYGTSMTRQGNLLNVIAPNQTAATLAKIGADSLLDGVGLQLSSGESLTTGNVLNVHSTSDSTVGGIILLDANNVKGGKGMKVETTRLSHGTAFDLSTGNGNWLQNAVEPISNFIYSVSLTLTRYTYT